MMDTKAIKKAYMDAFDAELAYQHAKLARDNAMQLVKRSTGSDDERRRVFEDFVEKEIACIAAEKAYHDADAIKAACRNDAVSGS